MRKQRSPPASSNLLSRRGRQRYIQDVRLRRLSSRPTASRPGRAHVCCTLQDALDTVKRIMEAESSAMPRRGSSWRNSSPEKRRPSWPSPDGRRLCPIGVGSGSQGGFRERQGPHTGGMGAYSPAPWSRRLSTRRSWIDHDPHGEGHGRRGMPLPGRPLRRPDDQDGEPKVVGVQRASRGPRDAAAVSCGWRATLPVLEAVVDQRLHRWRSAGDPSPPCAS